MTVLEQEYYNAMKTCIREISKTLQDLLETQQKTNDYLEQLLKSEENK